MPSALQAAILVSLVNCMLLISNVRYKHDLVGPSYVHYVVQGETCCLGSCSVQAGQTTACAAHC